MEDEEFTDRMVELLYGELPEDEEEAMRAHLERSDAAQEAFERICEGRELASMLTLEDPPPGLLDGVLAAARDAAAERAPATVPDEHPAEIHRATSPREAEPEEDAGLWGQFLQWIGGFATRPQFAMAMMLLLMIGIGMWYLPDFRDSDPADSQAVIDPTPGDEVGPSASLQPAEPLDLEADPRTGRIRPRDELGDAPSVRRPPADSARDEVAVTEADDADHGQADGDEGQAPAQTSEQLLAEETATPDEAGGEVITEAIADSRVEGAQLALAPGESTVEEAERAESEPTTQPEAAFRAGQVRSQAVPSMPAAEAEAPERQGSGAAARYARGMQRYRARDYRAAAEDFASVVRRPDTDARRLLPSAMHHQARSERAIGNCRAAVRTYEQLLGRYSSYSGAPEAMIEAADCYRRMGQYGPARRWLERASGQPSVAARARRELTVLAARERAAERAGSDQAAAAEPTGD